MLFQRMEVILMDEINYEDLFNKAIRKKSVIETLKQQRENLLELKKDKVKQMELKMRQQVIYEDSITIMKELIDKLSRTHLDHLESLLNTSVKTIFYDRDYRIEFEVTEFRNSNNLNIYLIETTDEGEIKTDLKDNGFGLKTIIGFVLQVYFILYHKQAPILFIDEALSALSTQYIPFLHSLIHNLAEEYNFEFILISHDPRFNDIADRIFEVQNGNVKCLRI